MALTMPEERPTTDLMKASHFCPSEGEIFEYLVAQALSEIGEERVERQELQTNRSLLRTRLKLLQQHGPGLGSMFGDEPAAPGEQTRLAAELLEKERQLESLGGNDSVLESELSKH